MNNRGWLYISLLLLVVSLFLNFFNNHSKYPTGCDEFGYLQLSEELAGNDEREAFLNPLINDLEKEGFVYQDYAWLILPHAYHVDSEVNKPVNQYQPGTSIILYFLNPKTKQILFPVLVLILGVGLVVMVSWRLKLDSIPLLSAITVFFIIGSFPGPFMTELSRVNSLAFTFIPLLLVGYFMFTNVKVALILLLLCVNFRIANLILVPFVGLLYLIQDKGRGWLQLLIFGGCALLPILIYNTIIFGNPFSLSYSSNDTSWANVEDFYNNVGYYLNWGQSWFRYHVFCFLALLAFSFFKKISPKRVAFLAVPIIANYLFFLFHKVQMNYYPYATLIILIGVLVDLGKSVFERKWLNWILLGLSSLVLIVMIVRFNPHKKNDQPDISLLNSYDVVWGDLYSSSSEYINKNRGMRYFAGSSKARMYVVNWLKNKGYSQAFILNDMQVDSQVLKEELKKINLNGKTVIKDSWQILEL